LKDRGIGLRKNLIFLIDIIVIIVAILSLFGEGTIVSKIPTSERVHDNFVDNYKICFNCHVNISGYGHFSTLFFVNVIEGRCYASWMYMWLSNASITIKNWHYNGKCNIHLIGYHGGFIENRTTHFLTLNGKAIFCLVREK